MCSKSSTSASKLAKSTFKDSAGMAPCCLLCLPLSPVHPGPVLALAITFTYHFCHNPPRLSPGQKPQHPSILFIFSLPLCTLPKFVTYRPIQTHSCELRLCHWCVPTSPSSWTASLDLLSTFTLQGEEHTCCTRYISVFLFGTLSSLIACLLHGVGIVYMCYVCAVCSKYECVVCVCVVSVCLCECVMLCCFCV